MKFIFIAFLTSLSFSAFADQCALISKTMADRAALVLQSGSEIASLCEPCGDRSSKISVVRSARSLSANYGNYQELQVNGVSVDLAYTFVKVAPNRFVNIAKIIGCKAEGVSSVISK